jgi:hypothetical protein
MNTRCCGLIGKWWWFTSTISWLYSRNAADHLRDLKLVLDRLQAGLTGT